MSAELPTGGNNKPRGCGLQYYGRIRGRSDELESLDVVKAVHPWAAIAASAVDGEADEMVEGGGRVVDVGVSCL